MQTETKSYKRPEKLIFTSSALTSHPSAVKALKCSMHAANKCRMGFRENQYKMLNTKEKSV